MATLYGFVWLMVFNATFNNISVISWRSVLLVEKSTDLSLVTSKRYHTIWYRVQLAMKGFELATLVVIDTDCTGSCKSNYCTISARWPLKLYVKSYLVLHSQNVSIKINYVRGVQNCDSSEYITSVFGRSTINLWRRWRRVSTVN
jgi:hypothetical protein